MKLILSRKGFDSGSGGVPSPIFPDGSMCSIPIQAPGARVRYRDIRKGPGGDMGGIVRGLTRGRIGPGDLCHFDPDLSAGSLGARHPRWRPSLGQVNAAEGHLAKMGVGIGDVFVFFGWFRRVERDAAWGWRFERGAPDLHVIFGWLRVEATIEVPRTRNARERLAIEHPWVSDHPHLHFPYPYVRGGNRIYVGHGAEFSAFRPERVLTEVGAPNRGLWRVPRWFGPSPGSAPMSYHGDPGRWSVRSDHCLLRTVGRGQEFVVDCAGRPQAAAWLTGCTGTSHREADARP